MKSLKTAILVSLPIVLGACASMPDWSDSDVPEEFREQIGQANAFPDFGATPNAPEDVPSAQEWDAKKAELEQLKGSFENVDLPPAANQAEINALIASLQAYVSAYKLDDPQ